METIVVNRGQKQNSPRQTATVQYKPSAKRLAQQDLPRIPRTSKYRTKPWLLTAARRDRPDDLTLIPGLTVNAEAALNALGIFHFDQIALWDDANVAWLQEKWPVECALAPRELIGPSRKLL
ncbi:MAG: hypothetical protein AAGI06_18945 [Pseudomonadota bacterium]